MGDSAKPEIPNNLLNQVTSFIGREKELGDVKRRLADSRLLTLTGSGGCGKTRLALEVARDVMVDYPDGVWAVELASLNDPDLVVHAVAFGLSIREQPGQSLLQTLIDSLKLKKTLLVLDNCEHLLAICAHLVSVLLRGCPYVKMLATSRELLSVAGEFTYCVPSLATPDPTQSSMPQDLTQYDAIRLFVARASQHKADFVVTNQNAYALAQICYRLDGIPLAIELAAARIRSLTAQEIDARLEDRFRLLVGGDRAALPRQQTLRATIDWSYDLLNTQEKLLFARLSVFAGGWTLEAAEDICTGKEFESEQVCDLLTGLVDKSIVIAEEHLGQTRYHMLATVRQYAWEMIQVSGEAEAVRGRCRNWFMKLAEQAALQAWGPEQIKWMRALEVEQDNIRAALTWSNVDVKGTQSGLRLVGAMGWFWLVKGLFSEGLMHLRYAIKSPHAQGNTPWRSKALFVIGDLALRQGDFSVAREAYAECLTIRKVLGDWQGVAASLGSVGIIVRVQGDYAQAHKLFVEGLAIQRQLKDRLDIAGSLHNLGDVHRYQGNYAAARTLYQESLEIRTALSDRQGISTSFNALALLNKATGNYAVARKLNEKCLSIGRELGDQQSIAASLYGLGTVDEAEGNYALARERYEVSLSIQEELGDKSGISSSLYGLGNVAVIEEDIDRARRLYEDSLRIRKTLSDRLGIAYSLEGMARLLLAQKMILMATRLLGAAMTLRQRMGTPVTPADHDHYNQQITLAHSILGKPAFTAAFEEGRAMTWEKAVAMALGESE